MLNAFVKDESGAVLVAHGALALGLTVAIVGLAGVVGSVMGHYSAIPNGSIMAVSSMVGLSQAAGNLDAAGLGEIIRLAGSSM